MNYDILQPWSTFVLKTRLPNTILSKMISITDKIISDENAKSWGKSLAGQIDKELYVNIDTLRTNRVLEFFHNAIEEFITAAKSQQFPQQKQQQNWKSNMISMWIVSQKDHEYNPCHSHTMCAISAVMYLKIPKYLPSRKEGRNVDGNIVFVNSTSNDTEFCTPQLNIKPEVGDLYIFPAKQLHFVYPFRTENGDGERRSVSFNANYEDSL